VNSPIVLSLSYFLSAIFPVIFWFWFFLRHDRAEPEPKRILLKAFLWGVVAIFVATLAGEVVSFLFSSGQNWSDLKNYITNEYYSVSSLNILAILGLLFLRGPIEEGVIFIIFMLFIYREKAFTQTIDGIVYGVALALGFSFVENTIYFTELFSTLNSTEFSFVLVFRGFASILLHLVATGIMGFYIGQARFLNKKKWRTIIKGVLIAMVLHGTFNVFLQASYPLNVSLAFILILLALLYLVLNIKKAKYKIIWRLTEK
jgi:protease PrsW